METETTRVATLAGAVLSALAASACCVGPLAFALLGLGGAGFLVAMEPYRPVFAGLTAAFLGVGFYLSYRPAEPPPAEDCACPPAGAGRAGRRLLWLATGLSALALAFPALVPHLF